MYDWYGAGEMGRLTVKERVEWAERQHRFSKIGAGKPSPVNRLIALTRREKAVERDQSGVYKKPASPRGI